MSASVLRFPRRVPQCEHCGRMFQLAEVAVQRGLFDEILQRID